jgi:hypothetical protein
MSSVGGASRRRGRRDHLPRLAALNCGMIAKLRLEEGKIWYEAARWGGQMALEGESALSEL